MTIPYKGKGKVKLGDRPFWCDLCGNIEWTSKATKLKNDTGHGGAIVCRNCIDTTDWSLVPYKPRPEKPVPWVRIDTAYTKDTSTYTQEDQLYPPFNYDYDYLPGQLTPDQYATTQVPWQEQTYLTWDEWLGVPWQNLKPDTE